MVKRIAVVLEFKKTSKFHSAEISLGLQMLIIIYKLLCRYRGMSLRLLASIGVAKPRVYL